MKLNFNLMVLLKVKIYSWKELLGKVLFTIFCHHGHSGGGGGGIFKMLLGSDRFQNTDGLHSVLSLNAAYACDENMSVIRNVLMYYLSAKYYYALLFAPVWTLHNVFYYSMLVLQDLTIFLDISYII